MYVQNSKGGVKDIELERERERLKFRELSLLFEVESSLRTTSSISAVLCVIVENVRAQN